MNSTVPYLLFLHLKITDSCTVPTFFREQQANLAKEDLSDMVAEHAAKQKVIMRTSVATVPGSESGFQLGLLS